MSEENKIPDSPQRALYLFINKLAEERKLTLTNIIIMLENLLRNYNNQKSIEENEKAK